MTARWQTTRGLIRRFRPDRNPLRRTADRVEAAILAGLILMLLAALPLAAHAAAGVGAAAGARAEHAQADWRQTRALVLRNSKGQTFTTQATPEALVPARWTAPDGTRHEGKIPVPASTMAGETVLVWTNRSGAWEETPVTRGNVVVWEVLDAVAAVAGVLLAAVGVFFLARTVLDRRRLAAWDAAWPLAESRWTGRP